MIDPKLLNQYGARTKQVPKGEVIFWEGEEARYYYQVLSGDIRGNNYAAEGREFIQAIYSAGRSFGEPALMGSFPYPANAVADVDSEVIYLGKEAFFQLLREHPEVHFAISQSLAEKLQYKAVMAVGISGVDAETKILRLLDYLKRDIHHLTEPFSFEVGLTRQQIADLCGLRVETVIRTLKGMAERELVKIADRKVFR